MYNNFTYAYFLFLVMYGSIISRRRLDMIMEFVWYNIWARDIETNGTRKTASSCTSTSDRMT